MLNLNYKYKKALINFGKIFNTRKQKEKHEFVYPIRSAGLTFSQAKNLDSMFRHDYGKAA